MFVILSKSKKVSVALEHILFCFPSQGVYEVYLDVNIVDDAEKMLTLHFNITAQVKSPGSKNAISGQLGGL